MVCRFLRAGYREDTASRLPLHSSSTSAPLCKQHKRIDGWVNHFVWGEVNLKLLKESKCGPYLACFKVSSNMENSLSLSACREQNIDSWKPALDFSLLITQD